MRLQALAAAALCTLALSTAPVTAAAADAKSKKPVASTKTGSSKAGKPARSAKSTAKQRSSSSRPSAKTRVRPGPLAHAPVPEPAPSLTPAQLELARLVQIGIAQCEFEQTVLIEPHVQRPGAFRVMYRKAVYDMVPEETTTGAVRLTDPKAGVVWLQIPVKSMLMDTRLGQRLVDACTSPIQRNAQAIAAATAQSVTGSTSLGIAAPLPAPAVPAAAFATPVHAGGLVATEAAAVAPVAAVPMSTQATGAAALELPGAATAPAPSGPMAANAAEPMPPAGAPPLVLPPTVPAQN